MSLNRKTVRYFFNFPVKVLVSHTRPLEKQGSGQTCIAVWFLQVQEFLGPIIARKAGVM